MNVVNLCRSNDIYMWNKFQELLMEAQNGNDRNAKNYINLQDKVHDHDAFHLLVTDEEEAVAFAGLYNNDIYPDSIARALNRAYYAKSVRLTGLPTNKNGRNGGGLLAKYILPEQVEIARRNRKAVFFSVEFNRRRRSIAAITKWINQYDRTYKEMWEALPDMYLTCPAYASCLNDPTCWQNVSILKFEDMEFPLPRKTRNEWNQKFNQ